MSDFDNVYHVNDCGVVVQNESTRNPMVYDESYLPPRYGNVPMDLAFLRISHLMTVVNAKGINPKNILDVGCGLGHFLKAASRVIPDVYSYDVIDHDFEWATRVSDLDSLFGRSWDVVCFYDSLEHMTDPEGFIEKLDAKIVCISVPWCHYETLGEEWFMAWKHRRLNEHFYHYSADSLRSTMRKYGYAPVSEQNIEDIVRTPVDVNFNILTSIFERN